MGTDRDRPRSGHDRAILNHAFGNTVHRVSRAGTGTRGGTAETERTGNRISIRCCFNYRSRCRIDLNPAAIGSNAAVADLRPGCTRKHIGRNCSRGSSRN